MRDHMIRMHPTKQNNNLDYFKNLEKFENRSKTGIKSFLKPSTSTKYAGGLKVSQYIFINCRSRISTYHLRKDNITSYTGMNKNCYENGP